MSDRADRDAHPSHPHSGSRHLGTNLNGCYCSVLVTHHAGPQLLDPLTVERLGEQVRQLMLRPDISELDVTALDPLPDVDVLGPLMLYRVLAHQDVR